MADDGVGSVDDLKIVITAKTEEFANGITATREMLARFVGDSVPMVGKFDAALANIGNTVGSIPAKVAAMSAAINPVLATIMSAYSLFQGAAGKMGMAEDADAIDAAFLELFATIGFGGPNALNSLGKSADEAKLKLAALLEAGEGAPTAVAGTASSIAAGVADTIRTVSAALAGLTRRPEEMSNDQLARNIQGLEGQIKQAEETGKVAFQNMEADGIAFGEVVYGVSEKVDILRDRLGKYKGELTRRATDESPADMKAYIANLEKGNEEYQLRLEVLGKVRAEAEEYLLVRRAELEAERQGKTMDDDATSQIDKAAARRKEQIEQEDAWKEAEAAKKRAADDDRRAADDAARKAERMNKSDGDVYANAEREIEALRTKVQLQGESRDVIAEATMEEKILVQWQKAGIEITDARIARARELAAEMGAAVREQMAADRERGFKNVDDETESIRRKTATVGMATDAAAAYMLEEKLLAEAMKDGAEITDEYRERIRKTAQERGKATKEDIEARRAHEDLTQSMRVVSGGLEKAFTGWMQGARVDTKELVSDMLAEFARLTLVRSVLQPLFGGGPGGGAGLFGDLLSGIFGGARAEGGPVDGGMAYLVGERGPEIFLPPQSGSIIPNHAIDFVASAGRGGSNSSNYSPVINLNIDARGATPDAVLMLEARLPAIVSEIIDDRAART